MKTTTLTGDVLSKDKVKGEIVNRSQTEAVRKKRLKRLAGIYA